MKLSRSIGVVVAAVGLMLTAFFNSGCSKISSESPRMDRTLVREGYSTAAMVYYIPMTKDINDSHTQILCSMVWVSQTELLTSFHCITALKELAQKEENQREAMLKEESDSCDELGEAIGICSKEEVLDHHVKLSEVKVHFYLWNEQVDIGKEPSAWHLGQVKDVDVEHDLALVEADGKSISYHNWAVLASAPPAIGEEVEVVGHPMALSWTFLKGSVAAYRGTLEALSGANDVNGPFMQVQVPGFGGNSGGGAFNKRGELVGIADIVVKAPNETFFTHLNSIREFLHPTSKK